MSCWNRKEEIRQAPKFYHAAVDTGKARSTAG